MLLRYTLQGDSEALETGVESSIDLPGVQAISLQQLQDLFPYYGVFHFRLKIADSAGATSYVWLDVTRSSDDLVELARNLGGLRREGPSGEAFHVKALPLSFDAPAENSAILAGEEFFDCGAATVASAKATATPISVAAEPQWQPQHTQQQQQQQQQPQQQSMFQDEGTFQWEDPPAEPQFGSAAETSARSRRGSDEQQQQQQQVSRPRRPSFGSGHKRGLGSSFGGSGSGHSRRSSGAEQDDHSGNHFNENNAPDWKAAVGSTITSAQAGLKSAINSKTAQDLKKNAQKGFGKLLGAVRSGAGGGSSSSSSGLKLPPAAAMDALDSLSNLLETPFTEGVRSHAALQDSLWQQLFDGKHGPLPNPPTSAHWKEAGFQSESIDADLAHTGLLCLRCLVHFTGTQAHRGVALQAMADQAAARSARSSYPFAVVGRNLTLMLADVLQLRGGGYARLKAPFWMLFEREGERAFAEVFCWSFKRLIALWSELSATRDDFGSIIGQVKSEVEGVLTTGPDSMATFLENAAYQ